VDIEKKWYVLYTKPRWEKKVAAILLARDIAHYCPLNRVNKQWTDRVSVVKEPLFKGYIFVQLTELNKWDIKLVEGVLNFVYWLGKPAVVKSEDIDTIKKFLDEFDDVSVVDEQLTKNERVLVKRGLMMDYKGLVLEIIDNKAKVLIDSMGVALIAIFEQKNLMKV
jgi:transcription antitermination factor NusG